MNWCKEHITEKNNWFVTKSGKKIEIQDDWKFCPICGAKRPERKGLAEKLESNLIWTFKGSGHSSPHFGIMAKTAIDHSCEVIDKFASEIKIGHWWTWDQVKQALRESI